MNGRFTPPKRRTVYVAPNLEDSLPPSAKEQLVRRRLLAATGKCPCGAVMPEIDIEALLKNPGVYVIRIEHEEGCPAIDGDH